MNRRMVFYTVGRLLILEAALMVLPALVSLCYGEHSILSFAMTIVVALVLGFALTLLCKPKDKVIFAREGFVIVALAWILISAVGALPFVISGEIPSYVDAFFETVSGFTTTGSSILTDVESLSHGMLFWRSFTHWVGGMGILVFIVAIMPAVSDRSIHILRAEMPGPTMGKLVPKIKQTAKVLYLIYIAMTLLEMILLLCGEMDLFESAVHALGTAGTGGFGIKASGIAGYSNYNQWVITVFMLLFGVNFNLYYLMLIGRFRSIFKSEELWTYLIVVLIAFAVITANILPLYENVADCVRLSAFQVSSIVTTTGYSTADFNLWPELSKTILLLLMFMGGCAGSTAGGLKVSRVVMLFKTVRREIKKLLHPRSVSSVRLEGKSADEGTLSSVGIYFALYIAILLAVFLLISIDSFDMETNFTATVSCLNNIGPAFGLAGPASNFAMYSPFSKIILAITMLLGRLEIYPLIIALSPSTWVKK